MKFLRFGQEWINCEHVVRINVTLPDPDASPKILGSFEFILVGGASHKIESKKWNNMEAFAKVFTPVAQALDSNKL